MQLRWSVDLSKRSRALWAFGLGPKSRPVGPGGIPNVRVGFEALIFRPAMLRAQTVWPSHKFGSEASWEKKYQIISHCVSNWSLFISISRKISLLYDTTLQVCLAKWLGLRCAADVAPGSGLTHSSSSTFVSLLWRGQSTQAPSKK